MKVLSLGAGVQSSALLLMSITGALPKLDAAVFSDTQWEPAAVYAYLDWLADQAAAAGIPIYRTTAGSLRDDALRSKVRGTVEDGGRWASMPLYTFTLDGRRLDDGAADPRDVGMIRRQCTSEYKIVPVKRCVRRNVLKVAPRAYLKPESVEMWIGISVDEISRVKPSQTQWLKHEHPLIYWLDAPVKRGLFKGGYTRSDCLDWMAARGFPLPPRSACIGCPFRSDREWVAMRDSDPLSWADAAAFDAAIRDCGGMRGQMYLHRSCVPLVDVQFDATATLNPWNQECEGMCGV